jgi:hypothetical protein
MTTYADIPKPIRSGLVIIVPPCHRRLQRGTPKEIIVLQFNPDSLERSVAPQASG